MKTKDKKIELYKRLIALEFDSKEFLMCLGEEAHINKEFKQWLEENTFHHFCSMHRRTESIEAERERPLLATMTREERRILIDSIDEGNYDKQ